MSSGITLRRVDSDEADELADRITNRAFGHAFDPAAHARRQPARRTGTYYIASRDADDAGSGGAFEYAMALPGGADVPVWGITAVGVKPDHRRRGVLTALMDRLLDDAAERGKVAAVLYASEGTIYPRFGFGMTSPRAHVRVAAKRAGFRPSVPAAAGRVRTVDLDEVDRWRPALATAYEQSRARRPGELTRNDATWQTLLARREGHDDRLFLVHEDATGTVAGYAGYTVTDMWRGSGPEHELTVQELVATDDAVELALWRALFEHDLVSTVTAEVPVDWLVAAAVADPWSVRMRTYPDGMWARLLDVPAALSGRRYRSPGRLVLQVVDDGRPACAGTFALAVDGSGAADCRAADEPPDLVLGSDVLARLWLGGESAARLVRAGQIAEAESGAGALADLLFGWDPAPFTTQHF